jgi:hypothetical protein
LTGLIYVLFFSGSSSPPASVDSGGAPLTEPAPVPTGYQFPLKGDQLKQWNQQAGKVGSNLNYCSFFSAYTSSRATPLRFPAAIVPKDSDPFGALQYTDRSTGRTYYPAYPATGSADQLTALLGGEDTAPDCGGLFAGGQPLPIMIEFPAGVSAPASGLVDVSGYMSWQYGGVMDGNNDFTAEQQGSYGAATVISAGQIKEASAQQALAPALYARNLDIAIRKGSITLRLIRVDFAADQTRLLVGLNNNSSLASEEGWTGIDAAVLKQGGSSVGLAPDGELAKAANSDGTAGDLLSSEPIPGGTGGGKPGQLLGYIIFPSIDARQSATLSLPDLPTASSNDPLPIRIDLPAKLNQRCPGCD